MANPEHLALLKAGVHRWNNWRDENPNTIPDLSGADLSLLNLQSVDFTDTNLAGAKLSESDLTNADLVNANLSGADVANALFISATVINVNFSGANLKGANFRYAVHEYEEADDNGTEMTLEA